MPDRVNPPIGVNQLSAIRNLASIGNRQSAMASIRKSAIRVGVYPQSRDPHGRQSANRQSALASIRNRQSAMASIRNPAIRTGVNPQPAIGINRQSAIRDGVNPQYCNPQWRQIRNPKSAVSNSPLS